MRKHSLPIDIFLVLTKKMNIAIDTKVVILLNCLLFVVTLASESSMQPLTNIQIDQYTCWQDVCNMKGVYEFCSEARKNCMSCFDVKHDCGLAKMQPNCTRFCYDQLIKQEKAKDCPRLPGITNGVHNGSMSGNIRYGAVVKATCNSGYEMVGDNTIRCADYGYFDKNLPACQERMVSSGWKVAGITLLCICLVLAVFVGICLFQLRLSTLKTSGTQIEEIKERCTGISVCHNGTQVSLQHVLTQESNGDSLICHREISDNVYRSSRTNIFQPELMNYSSNFNRDDDCSNSLKVPLGRTPTLEQDWSLPDFFGPTQVSTQKDKKPVQCQAFSNFTAKLAAKNASKDMDDQEVDQNMDGPQETRSLLADNGAQFSNKLDVNSIQNNPNFGRQLSNG